MPGGRQRPGREPREAATGTSVIRGRIVAADTGTPIRRAQVRAFAGELRESRMVSTDGQGRFELRDLPAGRWQLSASKAGFVTLNYGQRRPFESGRPIELGDGETMARADIALPRGAAVTGRLLDEFGDPVAGARVQAMRYRSMQGTRRLMPLGSDSTDDTGAFRLYGLTPGEYYVSATPQMGMFIDDSSDTTGYAPTYYPGTGNVAEAQRLSVAVGQELTNISFALLPTRTVKITGSVISSRGERVSNGFVMLHEASDTTAGMFMQRSGGRVRPDGSFTVANVTPGAYTLTVNTGMGMGPGSDEFEFATLRITVGNDDLSGVNLVTGRGATVTGTVVAAAGSADALPTAGVTVMQQAARFETMMGMGVRPARVLDDGSFRITGVFGERLFRVNGLPPAWTMKAVLLDGADITDTPMEFKGAEDVSGLQIVVTDRVAEITGKVTDEKGEPTRDYTVVVFPEDPAKWEFPSRYLRAARADQDGLYKIRALPPHDQYLAVAVDYIEDGEGGDPDFLNQVRDRATRLSLGEGETKALDLRVIAR